jgi:RNA polymerase sigma-70 factor (ECF subfamily)
MKNESDLRCVRQVKAGDVQAFSGIVSAYRNRVFTLVLRICENRDDAEDITQDIFISAFRSLGHFREESEFSTWLYRIAWNTAITAVRKRKIEFFSIDESLMPDGELVENEADEDLNAARLKYLDAAIEKISPDEKILLTLHYQNSLAYEEIGRITGMTVANIKVKMLRIRRKLALEIEKMIHDENC